MSEEHQPGNEDTSGNPSAPSLVELAGGVDIRSTALFALLVLAALYTLHFASTLLIPVTLATLISILLSPLVRYLRLFHIPAPLSALCLVAGLVVVLGLAVSLLAEPARQWIRDAPTNLQELRDEVTTVKDSLEDIRKISEEVDNLGKLDKKPEVQEVKVQDPDFLENLFERIPQIFAKTLIFVFLCFFLLASEDTMLRKAAAFGRTFSSRRRIMSIGLRVQSEIARYLATITMINLALGVAVGLAMWLLDVPNPLLWGTMAGLFNFAPYVGAIASLAVLSLVGITTFDDLGHALMVPGAFFVLTTLEGQLITPLAVGHRLSLSPTLVFISVVAWGWLWGVVGALIAVPLLVCFKVASERIPSLKPLSIMMER